MKPGVTVDLCCTNIRHARAASAWRAGKANASVLADDKTSGSLTSSLLLSSPPPQAVACTLHVWQNAGRCTVAAPTVRC